MWFRLRLSIYVHIDVQWLQHIFLKNQLIRDVWVYLYSLFQCSMCLSFCQYHTEYFTVGLEIRKSKSFTLFFSFKFVLLILISLPFHVNVRISFFISTKTNQPKKKNPWWDFDWNLIVSIYKFIKKWQCNCIESSNTRAWYISLFALKW